MSKQIPFSDGARLPMPRHGLGRVRAVASLLTFVICLLVTATCVDAQGGQLDTYRAAGAVAERYDGYLIVRDQSATAEVQDLVRQTNAERQMVYERDAATEGVPVDQVGRLYASIIFEKAPSGTWFLMENGNWVQK